MCGVFGILDVKRPVEELRPVAIEHSKRQRHRGPDWSGIFVDPQAILVHERLAIVDTENGAQPLYSHDGQIVLAVNGEIYNHKDLERGIDSPTPFLTQSDCEIIIKLYEKHGSKCVDFLSGIFAFVLFDKRQSRYLIARDHMGIVPLYWGRDSAGQLIVASELKALHDLTSEPEVFPPGHIYDSQGKSLRQYYTPVWRDTVQPPAADPTKLKAELESAVIKQMMCDVPYGVLLSGGLDSSIIASIVAKYASRRSEDGFSSPAWWPQLHTFAIGLKGAPDLAASREVASKLGSVHHECHYTLDEGIDALRDAIYHLETYDVTTIRAGTPMMLLARKIKAMGIKMVLSGEGADEIFGGYLYFHRAPNAQEFHMETLRKLQKLHLYDCLRANKAMAAWGVEARTPFLHKEFLEFAMALDPSQKFIKEPRRIEKEILRESFADMLPESIAWRQKEQFSDGVGYGWIDGLKDYAESMVSDAMLAGASKRFGVNIPKSKEAYVYRSIFSEHFPSVSAALTVPWEDSIACSSAAALAWDKDFAKSADPSGRAVRSIHASHASKA